MHFLNKLLSTLSENKTLSSIPDIKIIIGYFQTDSISYLQKAILSGEYYDYGHDKSIAKLDEIDVLIADYKAIITSGSIKGATPEQIIELLSVVDSFSTKYLSIFRKLAVDVKKRMENMLSGQEGGMPELALYQSDIFKELNEIHELNPTAKRHTDNYYTFQTNIRLAYVEESLECTDEMLQNLEEAKSFLKSLKRNKFDQDVVEKLIDKIDFLIFKINYRNRHISKENSIKPRTRLVLDEKNSYSNLYKKIKSHYSAEQDISDIEDIILKPIEKTSFEVEPFHHLNRFYTTVSSDNFPNRLKHISKLQDKLKEFILPSNDLSIYNKIAYASVEKLYENSNLKLTLLSETSNFFPGVLPHFKKYLKGDDSTLVEPKFFQEKKEEIIKISGESQFRDYYCHVIYIKFLNSLIEFLIQQPDYLLDEDVSKTEEELLKSKVNALLKYLEKYYKERLDDLNNSLDQMITHDVMPVYTTEVECRIPCVWNNEAGVESGVLFMHSSYILPNNFKSLQSKIHFWYSFMTPQMNLLKDSLAIVLNQSIITKNVGDSEKKIKESEIKMVQIVAMFVSIATFVLINVKIFDNKTALESFGIILGLAACFFLFNLFFYIIVLIQYQNEKNGWLFFKKSLKYLLIPIVFLGISLVVLHHEDSKTSKKIESLIKSIDTLKNDNLDLKRTQIKQGVIQDSIIRKR